MVYSPLINGITSLIYESVPDYPHPGRWWELIDKYKVTIFYTTPTAVRALMRLGDEIPAKYSFKSLRILGSVGEPINPKAWLWLYEKIGQANFAPVMDTWWQTETGMHIITPFPAVPLKPGSCFKPFFGIEAEIVDDQGKPVPPNTQGYLVLKKPWPSMLLGLYNNPKKYLETYFENESINTVDVASEVTLREADSANWRRASQERRDHEQQNRPQTFKNFLYFTGDSAKIDNDGYFWITGRNDDVIKVSGHRLGSAELEHALVEHPAVAEAAVIGKPHEVKGESIKAFIILKLGQTPSDELKKELVALVRKSIGPIATPDEIEFVEKLPKTRSGKIMRRVLKAQELGLPVGDTSTLES
jgi:acetyl-CoA synthetase